jgi:hypothetical protein
MTYSKIIRKLKETKKQSTFVVETRKSFKKGFYYHRCRFSDYDDIYYFDGSDLMILEPDRCIWEKSEFHAYPQDHWLFWMYF